jgi:hypothetical protein
VGSGVKPIVTNYDLPFVGDMRGHPGDELQIEKLEPTAEISNDYDYDQP